MEKDFVPLSDVCEKKSDFIEYSILASENKHHLYGRINVQKNVGGQLSNAFHFFKVKSIPHPQTIDYSYFSPAGIFLSKKMCEVIDDVNQRLSKDNIDVHLANPKETFYENDFDCTELLEKYEEDGVLLFPSKSFPISLTELFIKKTDVKRTRRKHSEDVVRFIEARCSKMYRKNQKRADFVKDAYDDIRISESELLFKDGKPKKTYTEKYQKRLIGRYYDKRKREENNSAKVDLSTT